jgi:transcriptional regulator with XRE-family HTH domain
MQAQSISILRLPYDDGMKTGRPAKTTRADFGARLHAMREAAGLTQQQVAQQLGITQASYALWERRNVALRADQLAKLAETLGVTTDAMIVGAPQSKTRGGPVGKMRSLFDAASQLPRSQQQRIAGVVADMLTAHRVAASS